MSERNPYNPGENDGAMQQRTLIAFILMAVVLFAMPYFIKQSTPPAPVKNAKNAAVKTAAGNPPPNSAQALAPEAAPPTPLVSGSAIAAHDEEKVVIDTDLYHLVFSNRGGVVTSWTLKKYPNAAGKPLELINPEAASKVWYPFSVYYRVQAPPVDLNQSLFVATRSSDGLGVTFEYADKGVAAKKTFQFRANSYLSRISSSIVNNGAPVQHLLAWRGGFGDFAVVNAGAIQHGIRYDVPAGKLETVAANTAKNGPVDHDGQFSFVGLEDQYFAAVFLPQTNGNIQTTVFQTYVPTPADKAEQPFVGTAVGGLADDNLELFVGPKDIDLLKQINPKLEQIVDFGFFQIVAKPLFAVLKFLYQNYVHNYGWTIVLVTICINFLLFPLRFFNMKSMKKMQSLQPLIAEINDRYKTVGLRDPAMAKKNEETMALYKEHGANPMAGCIPLVIQMPFLFAFYKVLGVSIQMRGAEWLWVTDLSQPEHFSLHVLPIIMIASSFFMQRMTPMTGMDPAQQRMMMFMPLIMGFFFYNQSSGLVLYWLTGNLLGIAQQWFFNKLIVVKPVPVPVKASGSKGSGKKPVRR